MPKPFTPTDAMREMMADARAAFGADTSYAVSVGKAAAAHVQRRDLSPESEEIPAPPQPHVCPDSHEHGSDRCVMKDRCTCQVCETSRAERASRRRSEALQRHESREVTVRRVQPTKTAPAGVQQGAYKRGTRQLTSREPVELPPGMLHGGANAYQHHSCRCDECRAWKSAANKRARLRAAERGALQQWHRPDHDD